MGDVGLAVQRAEDKTAQLQARAGAIDELLASGALDDPTGTQKDDITLELEQLASTSDVEDELNRMSAQIGGGTSGGTQAIGGGQAPAIEGQPVQQAPATTGYQAPAVQPGQPAQPNAGDLR